jgi:hypothetical protein
MPTWSSSYKPGIYLTISSQVSRYLDIVKEKSGACH